MCTWESPAQLLEHVHALVRPWRSNGFIFSLSYTLLFNLNLYLSSKYTLFFSLIGHPPLRFLHTLAHAAASAWNGHPHFPPAKLLLIPQISKLSPLLWKLSHLTPNRTLPLDFCNILFLLPTNTGSYYITVSAVCLSLQYAYEFMKKWTGLFLFVSLAPHNGVLNKCFLNEVYTHLLTTFPDTLLAAYCFLFPLQTSLFILLFERFLRSPKSS